MDRKVYDFIKARLSDYDKDGVKGIKFDNAGLNEGVDELDPEYIESLIFEGRKNKWNTAEEVFSMYPSIKDRVK